MTAPTTFPSFSRFPAELRLHIWSLTFPAQDRPAVYFYRDECWQPRQLAPGEHKHYFYSPFDLMETDYRPDSLAIIRIRLPQDRVNFEARSLTHDWARQQGFEVHNTSAETITLRPPYYEGTDVMYVRSEDCRQLVRRALNPIMAVDPWNNTTQLRGALVKRLAIPAKAFREVRDIMSLLLQSFCATTTLYIIVSSLPPTEDASRFRLELEYTRWPKYCWNTQRERFEWQTNSPRRVCEWPASELWLRRLVMDACRPFEGAIQLRMFRPFEIQFATMVIV